MAVLILDASVTLAWLLPDEVDRERAALLVERAFVEGAVAPPIWPSEVGNALLVAERRGRVPARDSERLTRSFLALAANVEIAAGHDAPALGRRPDLARRHGLSFYDASYLELAGRLALPLATFDARLRRAAEAERVPLAG